MLPVLLDRRNRISDSISNNCLLFAAFCTTKLAFCALRSGSSSATTTPNSCSSKPPRVIVKLSRDTFFVYRGEKGESMLYEGECFIGARVCYRGKSVYSVYSEESVYRGYLHLDFWCIMRVRELCSHEEFEYIVIGYDVIAYLHHLLSALYSVYSVL